MADSRIGPIKSQLVDMPDYLGEAAVIANRTLHRIAIAIDNLGQAEAEAAMHRKSLEQWRKTMSRTQP